MRWTELEVVGLSLGVREIGPSVSEVEERVKLAVGMGLEEEAVVRPDESCDR